MHNHKYNLNWYEKIGNESVFHRERCFLFIVTTDSSCAPYFYAVEKAGTFYCDQFLEDNCYIKYQNDSRGIVLFIYESYCGEFDKKIKKQGFRITKKQKILLCWTFCWDKIVILIAKVKSFLHCILLRMKII